MGRQSGQLAAVEPDDGVKALEGDVTDEGPKHLLVLGDDEFECGEKMPLGTLVRYANNDLLGIHHVLVKLVDPAEHERMWDAFEKLDQDEVMEAVKGLIESYSNRPTAPRSSSRAGSKRGARR